MPGEFELIHRYFAGFGSNSAHVSTPIGDDCAVLDRLPANHSLAISTDTLIADVHFPAQAKPAAIASRALRASVSDLAAMAASAYGFTLALTLPDFDDAWLAGFSKGLQETANQLAIPLVGGDTTRGPLSLTLTVLGAVNDNAVLNRSSAKIGDGVFVTGTLGDGAAALALLKDDALQTDEFLQARYFEPHIDLALAQVLGKFAHAAVDVSDGLLADLQHITQASGVAARLHLGQLPYSPSCLRVAASADQAQHWALTGGDDYRLCFTMPAQHLDQPALVNAGLHQIGTVESGEGLRLFAANGREKALPDVLGYEHGT